MVPSEGAPKARAALYLTLAATVAVSTVRIIDGAVVEPSVVAGVARKDARLTASSSFPATAVDQVVPEVPACGRVGRARPPKGFALAVLAVVA